MILLNIMLMEETEKQARIKRMSSVCKNCKHINFNDKIYRFWCGKFDMVIMGVVLNCLNGFERKE